jgi:hypothetical protein
MLIEDRTSLVAELLDNPPAMHWVGSEPQAWGLDPDVMRWVAEHLPAGANTLETGCGVSSIFFSLVSGRHTIVAPYDLTHQLARKWCEERGVATDHVRSVIDHSQEVLPTLETGPLDLILIDGAHAMPFPFLDWYFTARHLNVGGYLVVDDMQVRSCELLKDFLCSETARWRVAAEIDRAVIFERHGGELIPSDDWLGQPFNHMANGTTRPLPRRVAGRLKRAIGGS